MTHKKNIWNRTTNQHRRATVWNSLILPSSSCFSSCFWRRRPCWSPRWSGWWRCWCCWRCRRSAASWCAGQAAAADCRYSQLRMELDRRVSIERLFSKYHRAMRVCSASVPVLSPLGTSSGVLMTPLMAAWATAFCFFRSSMVFLRSFSSESCSETKVNQMMQVWCLAKIIF